MKKTTSKKIKNSTLVFLFFSLVILTIIVSIIVKLVLLIAHSTFDNHHQFIVEVKEPNGIVQLLAFNPTTSTLANLTVKGIKNEADVVSLLIPVDAVYTPIENVSSNDISNILFPMIYHCSYPVCQGINTVDAIKLYWFSTHIPATSIQIGTVTIPVSQGDFKNTIQNLFTDETLYHEALSISVINASGQPGLGNQMGQFLTNIGGNVVSVTSGEVQPTTTMQSDYSQESSYSVQRIQQVLHLHSQKMQSRGISDIIITIGEHHPQL